MSSTGAITIRPALAHDAGVLHAMLVEFASATTSRTKLGSTVEDLDGALSGPSPQIHALIAEQGQRPVGMAIFFLSFSTWRGSVGVYLQDIYVANDARSSGLGKRLLCAVASWAHSRGASYMRLSVNRNNVAAHAFYTRIGMTYRDDEMIFEAVGESFEQLQELT